MSRLPIVLIQNILELSSSITHREYMNKLRSEIILASTKRIAKNHWYSIFVKDMMYNPPEFYEGSQQYLQYYKILSKCNCCDRHQCNRPNLSDYIGGFCPPYPIHTTTKQHKCRCICRHYCRCVCRSDNDSETED
jgi:hypothetical protein